ncbi:MAG: hypothetical protein ACE5PM_05490 [Candidatus Hydrothermarchaeales archaeon]
MIVGDTKIYLDPKNAKGLSFISHAHSDHAPRRFSGRIIYTDGTKRLLRNSYNTTDEGYNFDDDFDIDGLKFRLVSSGHILGSSQIMIEDGFTLTYTGDLDVEGGTTTGRAPIPRCDILIIESTFGSPYYHFPKKSEVVKEMKDWIDECFGKGITPILMGYSLGKAQDLTKIFSKEFNVVVHDSIYDFNKRYEELGVGLGGYHNYGEFDGGEDFLLIAPPRAMNNKAVENLDGYSKALASGWAIHEGVKYRYGVDEAFPLSNHSDFDSLVKYVERADPQVVYTVHGFIEEFSNELRSMGFYSQPLIKRHKHLQESLDGYM